MYKFIFFLGFALITSIFQLQGQTVNQFYLDQAVRFSQTNGGGSARIVGLGGANVAIGGDISSISGNPAGLGFYNRSGWTISSALRIGDYNSTYLDEATNNMGINLQVPNMGMVFHNKFEEYAGSEWISGTFGIAVNQQQAFYNNINYDATREAQNGVIYDFTEAAIFPFINDDGSLMSFNNTSQIGEVASNDFFADLAYRTYLIDIYNNPDGSVK